VDFDHGINNAIKRLREALGDSAEHPRLVETLPKRGYRFIAPVNRGLEPYLQSRNKAGDSIAVFPLANANANPDMEYLAAGVPESIMHCLSRIPDLSVVAGRGISGTNQDQGRDALVIGRRFNVRAALLGRILQRRTKLCLQVDLVDTRTGEELWSDQYNRDLAELFLVQDDVVNQVSKQLRLNLGQDDGWLNKRYTENTEAYQLYLKGRHCFEQRTREGFRRGIEHLKQAVHLDPRYALAYAHLAAALCTPGYYGYCRREENFPPARVAADTALELDDNLAEAHEALATLNLFDWRWSAAEEEYKRGLEINPNHALSHFHYAMYLAELGRSREAIRAATEAQIRDPLSGAMNAGLAWTLWAAREYEKCLTQSITATELEPNSLFARITSGVSYEQNGMYRESIAEFQEGVNRQGGSLFLGFQGHALARSGEKASAWNNIRKMEELARTTYVTPAHLALTYAGLEEKDLAIGSLQKSYDNGDAFLVFTRMLPQFENLHSDARFQELLQRMNFP